MSELPDDLIALPTMPYNERPPALPLDVEECRTALWLCRGNVTKAAGLLKTSSKRLRAFVVASPYLSAEMKEATEQMLDKAEDVIYEALTDEVDAGRRDTMARFVATNLGASRGYGTQKNGGINLNLPNKGTMQISWGDGATFGEEAPAEPKTIEHSEAAE